MTEQHYIQDTQLAARFAVSRITIWRWARKGTFPQPIKLTPGCTRWRLADVEHWENERGAV